MYLYKTLIANFTGHMPTTPSIIDPTMRTDSSLGSAWKMGDDIKEYADGLLPHRTDAEGEGPTIRFARTESLLCKLMIRDRSGSFGFKRAFDQVGKCKTFRRLTSFHLHSAPPVWLQAAD